LARPHLRPEAVPSAWCECAGEDAPRSQTMTTPDTSKPPGQRSAEEVIERAAGTEGKYRCVAADTMGEFAAPSPEQIGRGVEAISGMLAAGGASCLLPRRLCGGAGFRMGITISTAGEGLRGAARRFGGSALCRLRLPLPPAGDRHPRRGFITRSRNIVSLVLAVVVIIVLIWLILQFARAFTVELAKLGRGIPALRTKPGW
jgi:hypothetical protein